MHADMEARKTQHPFYVHSDSFQADRALMVLTHFLILVKQQHSMHVKYVNKKPFLTLSEAYFKNTDHVNNPTSKDKS